MNYINTSTGTNTLFTDRTSDNTVYSMWIGTNDLGDNAFLTDSQVAGSVISNFTSCVFQALDGIYETGARYFVLMNMAPLQLSPLYGLPDAGGVYADHYWPNKVSSPNSLQQHKLISQPGNTTEVSYKMWQYTTSVNEIWKYQLPFELLVAKRYPGAAFSIFDVHSLMTDIYNHPNQYFESPANVTGYWYSCNLNSTVCKQSDLPMDSFMWYDELHPSVKTDEIIAKEFINVVGGNSSYATYW